MKSGRPHPSEAFLRTRCHEHNLRVTPQRLAIFKLVRESTEHPNADAVFRRIRRKYSDISFDTVNRTLLSFARIGILKVVEGYGYPKRFDPKLESHHHFHCVRCNRIIDFHEVSFDALRVPRSISEQHTVIDKRVVLEGICDKCWE